MSEHPDMRGSLYAGRTQRAVGRSTLSAVLVVGATPASARSHAVRWTAALAVTGTPSINGYGRRIVHATAASLNNTVDGAVGGVYLLDRHAATCTNIRAPKPPASNVDSTNSALSARGTVVAFGTDLRVARSGAGIRMKVPMRTRA